VSFRKTFDQLPIASSIISFFPSVYITGLVIETVLKNGKKIVAKKSKKKNSQA
jgi:hypothetical protein